MFEEHGAPVVVLSALMRKLAMQWLRMHPRLRRVLLYGGLAISLCMVVFWILVVSVGLTVSLRKEGLHLCLSNPQDSILKERDPNITVDYTFGRWKESKRFWGIEFGRDFFGRFLVLPAWIFIFTAVLLAVIAWRSKPNQWNHCRHCDYDLTGNASGVCPECGTRV